MTAQAAQPATDIRTSGESAGRRRAQLLRGGAKSVAAAPARFRL